MSAQARALGAFKAARIAIQEVKRSVTIYDLNQKKLQEAVPQTNEYMARAAISKELVAVVENLNGIKDAHVRAIHRAVFHDLYELTAQRNILSHHYGHADKIIDWSKIWVTIDERYPRLETALEDAIKDLESL